MAPKAKKEPRTCNPKGGGYLQQQKRRHEETDAEMCGSGVAAFLVANFSLSLVCV